MSGWILRRTFGCWIGTFVTVPLDVQVTTNGARPLPPIGSRRVGWAGGVRDHLLVPPSRSAAHPAAASATRALNRTTTGDGDIAAPGVAAQTVVVTAREDLEIRRQALGVLRDGQAHRTVAE